MKQKVIAVVSGGLDSTTMLYYIINNNYDPIVLTFDYRQKHQLEVNYASMTCKKLGVPQIILDIPRLPGSSLTEEGVEIPKEDYSVETQKSTVVPNRNMVFLSIAASYAIAYGAEKVFYAAHWNDRAVYPDCTQSFVSAMNVALATGNSSRIRVEAPFIKTTKAEIVSLGQKLGVPFEDTWSCYDPRFARSVTSNYGTARTFVHCGKCGTCRERKEAFRIAGVEDPTVYAEEVK